MELELLKETIPQSTLIGVLWTPTSVAHASLVKAVEAAGRKLGTQLELAPVRDAADFDRAFAQMTRVRVGSLLVIPSPLVYAHRALVTRLALEHKLPSMFGSREHADAGGLAF
jgi:putative ABC transport system substrate-binding protein